MAPMKNAKGQLYPWAIEGRNFGMFEVGSKFQSFIASFASEVGKTDEAMQYFADAETATYENDGIHDECANGLYFGGTEKNQLTGVIKVNVRHQGYGSYFTPEQEPAALECYEKTKKVADEVSEKLRNKYVGRTDERSLHMQEKANELADWIDLQSKLYDPKAGNIMEAEFHAPYLFILNVMSGGAPKYDSQGLEKCVDVLEQKGIPGGTDIYDDYMTLMSAGARETAIQYDRQKMEETGWDASKEADYLKRLHYEHQKSIDAFDRLWEVDDHGQYDSVLNNPVDELISKKPNAGRDMNDAIGFMRGENRAIELGYDSTHLLALGQLGMQEQTLRKIGFQLDKKLETEKDPEERKALEQQKEKLQEYKKDLDELKKDVWNKSVNGRKEMEATGKKVDDFFAAHQEKYADLQDIHRFFKTSVEYVKETAQNAPEIDHSKEQLTLKEVDALGKASGTLQLHGLDPQAAVKYALFYSELKTDGNMNLKPKSVQDVKSFAGDLSTTIDQKMPELDAKAEQYPHAIGLQKALLKCNKQQVDNLKQGISTKANTPMVDQGFDAFISFQANMEPNAFQPENLEKTEKVAKELGIDQVGEKVLKIQQLNQSFELNKDKMLPTERRKALRELNKEKAEAIKLFQKMDEKLANPSEEVKSMFVNDDQLRDVRGIRGIKGAIESYSLDFMKVDLPQADQMPASLAKFNASRAVVFRNESDAHREMREAAEQVQKDMEQLQKGTIKDSQTGKERTMTKAEKEKAMKEAWKHVGTLDEKTDAYITHATKNGTKTPNTPAGKDRLAGAREMKSLMAQYKDQLAAQPELQAFATKDRINDQREAKYGKGGAKALSSMDKEVEKLQGMSKLEAFDSTTESRSFGLNEFEFQVAKVVAIAGVTEGLEKGKIEPLDLKAEFLSGTKKVAGDAGFKKWVKEISKNPEKIKEFTTKYPNDVKNDFVNSLSKDLEKEAQLKKDGPKKDGPKVEDKKNEKKKTDPQIKDPVKD